VRGKNFNEEEKDREKKINFVQNYLSRQICTPNPGLTLIDTSYLHVMKRYEYKIIAALVTILISMCCPTPALGAPYKRGSQSKFRGKVIDYKCTESNSYFFRSQCSDNGFLTVVKNRVLVQTSGLNSHHRNAEFVIETCTSNSLQTSSSQSPIVRYRHKNSKKYICFTKTGKVRTVREKQVERRGLLCMFRQKPVEVHENAVKANTYHRLQSVHNRLWHLGFDHRNGSLTAIKGTPHRGALPKRGKSFNPHKCDFNFFADEFVTKFSGSELEWEGVFDLISRNNMVSKADFSSTNGKVGINELSRTETNQVVDNSQHVISDALKEVLKQQKNLKRNRLEFRKRRKRIRHVKHKKPRLDRVKKNLLKRRRKNPISKS